MTPIEIWDYLTHALPHWRGAYDTMPLIIKTPAVIWSTGWGPW